MDNIVLSLIVPVYGVEQYIGDFLQSLEPNLLSGVEVIIVDDGTKDKSGLIADEFAAEHSSFVRVIHKDNGGVSSARNAGLKIAKGEYFLFADSDDILEKDFTKKIFEAIEKFNHPDMLFCNFKSLINDSLEKNLTHNFPEGMMEKETFLKLFVSDKIASMVWNKAIKKEIVGEIEFPQGVRIGEDAVFLSKVALKAKSFVYLDECLYNWRLRSGSATRTMQFQDCLEIFNVAVSRYHEYKKYIKNASIVSPVRYCYMALKEAYLNNIYTEDVTACEKFLKDNFFVIMTDNEISNNGKNQCALVLLGLARTYLRLRYGK